MELIEALACFITVFFFWGVFRRPKGVIPPPTGFDPIPYEGLHYLMATRHLWSPRAQLDIPPGTEPPTLSYDPNTPFAAIYDMANRAIQEKWAAGQLPRDDDLANTGDLSDAEGYVYILFNPTLPGLLKIGMTTRSADERARELSQATGVAADFVVAFEQPVSDCADAERRVHEALAPYRYNDSREFFHIGLKDAIRIVADICDEVSNAPPAFTAVGYTPDIGVAEITKADQVEGTSRYSIAIRCRHCAVHFPVDFPTSNPAECPECGKSNATAAGREAMGLAKTFLSGDPGRGISKDAQRAIHCFRQAARWGNTEAAAWLADRLS
jgi:hypothetical protein